MAVLESKTALLGAIKLKSETVHINGGEVIVQEVTASEYMEVHQSELSKGEDGEFDGALFASVLATHCIVDRKGNRIFEDSDAALLRGGSTTEYAKILKAVNKLNGIGEQTKN